MLDIQKLIDIRYLLDPKPSYNFAFFVPTFVVMSIAFIVGIVLATAYFRRYVWSEMIGQWLRWFGFTGLILLFFRYEGIPFLSIRIYFIILTLGFFVWLIMILRNFRLIRESQIEKARRQESYDKYLPRPKRKRA